MTNVFAFPDTEDEECLYDGKRFLAKRTSPDLLRRIDEVYEGEEEENEPEPKPRRSPRTLILKVLLWAVVILSFFLMKDSLTAEEPNSMWMLYGILEILSALGILLINRRQKRADAEKEIPKTLDEELLERRMNELVGEAKVELKIPADATEIDVLSYMYKEKKGVKKHVGAMMYNYIASPMWYYAEGQDLCLATCREVFRFPARTLLRIEKRCGKVTIPFFTKEDSPKSERYAPYRLSVNSLGFVSMKECYALVVDGEEEGELEILIPPYDIAPIASLLGFRVPSAD